MRNRAEASSESVRNGSTRRTVVAGVTAGLGGLAAGALLTPEMAEAASLDGYFNVKDHGAVGNGSTDDTTAIQDAIAAAILSPVITPTIASATSMSTTTASTAVGATSAR
jgi:hypothetical protein